MSPPSTSAMPGVCNAASALLVLDVLAVLAMLFPLMMSMQFTLPLALGAWGVSALGSAAARQHGEPERARVVHALVFAAWAYTLMWPVALGLSALALLVLVLPARLRAVFLLPLLVPIAGFTLTLGNGEPQRDISRTLELMWPLFVHIGLLLLLVFALAVRSIGLGTQRR